MNRTTHIQEPSPSWASHACCRHSLKAQSAPAASRFYPARYAAPPPLWWLSAASSDQASPQAYPVHAESDDDDDEVPANTDRRKRQKSDSSNSSGVARRNAEAGTQLSRSVDNLSAMSKPIVTPEDLSHVDEVICILQDKTLLPPDPRRKLFRLVSSALSLARALARVFVLEQDFVRRKGILEGILEDKTITVPDDY
ncbi:hypothetical protein B0H17DRAFT_1214833 [Mycena rosella]|uniref:Uncharacterized protein n=1 Tax=Mycena rosella TaxID=1033263 RepID=A0AAD7G411_MYCRO|nr:hypothetical protein B0H17DRAFT_1214833 [Mycena rosella]